MVVRHVCGVRSSGPCGHHLKAFTTTQFPFTQTFTYLYSGVDLPRSRRVHVGVTCHIIG